MTYKKPVKFLLLRPDWRERIRVARAFLTTVTTAKSRLEQRAALKTVPKRTIKYVAAAFSQPEAAYLHRKLYKEMHALLGIPIWPDFALLSAQANAGTNILSVDSTDDMPFVEGGQVVLISESDPDTYDVGVIDELASDLIMLEDNLTNSWASGSQVWPMLSARIDQAIKVPWRTDSLASASIEARESWEVTTTTTTTTTTSSTASTTSSTHSTTTTSSTTTTTLTTS